MKLGDVCDVLNGFAFKSRQYVDKGIRIIRIANVQKGYLEDSKPCFYPVKLTDSLKQYILEENDLLVSLTGNVGRVALLEKSFLPAALNQRVACLRIKDESRICKRYLYHALNSSLFENNCVESANGIAQKNMSTTWLKGYRIPAPSMVEQEIIIKQLDLIQGQISNVKRQLSEFDSLVKSRFVEMFGSSSADSRYEVCRIGDIADVFVGVVIKPKQYYTDDHANGIKAFRSLNVGEMQVRDDDWVYFSKEGNKKAKKTQLHAGDVLVVRSGYPGTSCVVPLLYEGCNAVDLIIARSNSNNVLPEYIAAFNNGSHMKSLINQMSVGSAQKHFNIGFYRNVEIPLPPLSAQKEYVSFLRQVDKSRFVRDHEMNFRWERFTLSWSTIA